MAASNPGQRTGQGGEGDIRITVSINSSTQCVDDDVQGRHINDGGSVVGGQLQRDVQKMRDVDIFGRWVGIHGLPSLRLIVTEATGPALDLSLRMGLPVLPMAGGGVSTGAATGAAFGSALAFFFGGLA